MTASLSQVTLEKLEPGIQPFFASCMERARTWKGDLRGTVREYLQTLSEKRESAEFLDLEKAQEIAARCEALIERYLPALNPEITELLTAAVLYLVLSEDAASDTDSILGFDDDALVVEATEMVLREQA